MQIATILLTHGHPELTKDTVESIKTWVGSNLLIVVDEVGWNSLKDINLGARKIKGFYHNFHKSPYRNYTLGLMNLYEAYPDSDWFCYVEYDVLFASDKFKKDLGATKAWSVGCDVRKFKFEFPLLEEIIGSNIKSSYYLLGACQFHRREFISKLYHMGFFPKFLKATNDFMSGRFPDYGRWAFEEELWATLAIHLGGDILELTCWKGGENGEYHDEFDSHMLTKKGNKKLWRGDNETYIIRNDPEIKEDELHPNMSIIHPVKTTNKIRTTQAENRKQEMKKRLTYWA